ncbi:MAG: threonine synthase [Candidatus Kryptonium sp.]|nr:threonine synthase [Candidatus Kryptonium sp.]MCX7762302.1 threonine synthase [Candidatus Kryptonium sp.]
MKSFIIYLKCSICGEVFDHKQMQRFCQNCNEPLIAIYDYDEIRKNVSKDSFKSRVSSMWRYFEFLPVLDERKIITLGEGWTPLLRLGNFGDMLGLKNLYVKDESFNPTLSFKARGLSCAVSKAVELGIDKLALPTAGNAGSALSAYCAKAGIKCFVSAPRDTPSLILKECEFYGAEINLIDGLISDALKVVQKRTEFFDISTMREPYRLQGKKTLGFEIIEQLGWEVPDWIIYPTGGGTGLIGIWIAVKELIEVGLIEKKFPKMVAVQSAGCAPIVKAYNEGKSRAEFWENAQTIAYGLRVPKPFADRLILEVIRESKGLAIQVEDDEIIKMMEKLSKVEGIIFCPEGSATAVALEKLVSDEVIGKDEVVVIVNTASGLKYI